MTKDNVCVEVVDLTGRIYKVLFLLWGERKRKKKEKERKNNVMEGCVNQHAAHNTV